MNTTITFEIGDIAEDVYHCFRGEVVELKTVDGLDYIILRNSKGDRCSSRLRVESVNTATPFYLRLICKKAEIPTVLAKSLEY